MDIFRKSTQVSLAIGRLFVLMLCFLAISKTNADQNTSIDRESFINITRSCFNDGMRSNVIDYKSTSFTEAYIAESLFSIFEQSDPKLTRANAEHFCKQNLVPKYQKYYESIVINSSDDIPILAKLGTTQIELNNKFIQWTNNAFLRHSTTGHSDLTLQALEKLPSDIKLEKWARRLVIRASQSPDIYRWEDERYHAHTVIDVQKGAKESIKAGQIKFTGLVNQIMAAILENIQSGDISGALFWMGVGCHPLQDLVYHRGMTMQQHAWLTYEVKDDPDTPSGELFHQRVEEANAYCQYFLQKMLRKAGDRLYQLQHWSPSDAFDFTELAERKFRGEPDMTINSLWEYRKLAWSHSSGKRPFSRQMARDDIVVWDVKDIISKLYN